MTRGTVRNRALTVSLVLCLGLLGFGPPAGAQAECVEYSCACAGVIQDVRESSCEIRTGLPFGVLHAEAFAVDRGGQGFLELSVEGSADPLITFCIFDETRTTSACSYYFYVYGGAYKCTARGRTFGYFACYVT